MEMELMISVATLLQSIIAGNMMVTIKIHTIKHHINIRDMVKIHMILNMEIMQVVMEETMEAMVDIELMPMISLKRSHQHN